MWYEPMRIPHYESEEQGIMAMKKIAISLPQPVLERVDRLAASRGESRSHLIATVLDRVARAKHDRDITAQIDALFTDEKVGAEQKATADEFLRMSPWPKGKW
jgi:Arc/MetJ-type ribon-helix-helix transcriptional regulator